MYNESILVLNQSYRKFKDREKDAAFFYHFLAVVALKYISDSKDKLYSFKPEPSQAENLRLIFSQSTGVSKAILLDKAIGQLSKKYTATMAGIFEDISFKDLIADKKKETETRLSVLTEEIADLILFGSSTAGASGKEIGPAVEYLIEKFAEEHFHKSGFLYTPRSISRLMAELADVNDSVSIYDPAAGLGTLLIQAAKAGKIQDFKLYGQEIDPRFVQLCKFNMLFNGLLKSEIETGNSLQDSKFESGKKPILFDRIITHPPFDIDKLLPAEPQFLFDRSENDKSPFMVLEEPAPVYKKAKGIQIAEDTAGEVSFLSHILTSLQEDGKAVLIVPHGVLFKLGTAYAIRKQLVNRNLVEAVVDLPPNIFYSSKVNVSVLVLNKKKQNTDLLFIDASQNFEPDRRRNKLRDEHLKLILDTFLAFKSVPDYAHRATMEEIAEKSNDYNLTAKRYLKHISKSTETDLDAMRQNIDKLSANLALIRQELEKEMDFFKS